MSEGGQKRDRESFENGNGENGVEVEPRDPKATRGEESGEEKSDVKVGAGGVRCGLYMAAKKRPKFQAFVEVAKTMGLEMIDLELEGEGAFPTGLQAILHKMTDDIATLETDPKAKHRVDRFDACVKANPQAVIIDPLANVRPLLKREDMMAAMQNVIDAEKLPFKVPKSVKVADKKALDNVDTELKKLGMKPPYICKCDEACGVAKAHDMVVVARAQDAARMGLPYPLVVQEFINHDNVIWKVYVLGSTPTTVQRPSLPNMSLDDIGEGQTLDFNSQRMNKAATSSAPTAAASPPDVDTIQALATALSVQMGLSLYGVDVIRSKDSGEFLLVDMNYFPGYEGVPRFHEALAEHIMRQARSQK